MCCLHCIAARGVSALGSLGTAIPHHSRLSVCLCPHSVFPGVVWPGFGTSLGSKKQLKVAQHLLSPWLLGPGPVSAGCARREPTYGIH